MHSDGIGSWSLLNFVHEVKLNGGYLAIFQG